MQEYFKRLDANIIFYKWKTEAELMAPTGKFYDYEEFKSLV